MEALNILIVEDELLISEMLKEMVLELGHNVVGQAKNDVEAFELLNDTVDLLFLDINLKCEKSGIEIAQEISENHHLPFIFITSYSDQQTLQDAAATKPLNYLIKPFEKKDIQAALIMFQGKKEPVVFVKDGYLKIKLPISRISSVKSENNYLEIYSQDKKYVIRQSLDNFLEDIGSNNMVRVHRSHAVNMDKVEAVNGKYVLIAGEKIPLSRKYRNEILEKFSR